MFEPYEDSFSVANHISWQDISNHKLETRRQGIPHPLRGGRPHLSILESKYTTRTRWHCTLEGAGTSLDPCSLELRIIRIH